MTIENFDTSDTICAIATPPGCGGIATIRVSGAKAIDITETLWRGKTLHSADSHTAHFGEIIDPSTSARLDQAVATVFKAPRSYTGDDTVEISVHGSVWIQQELLRLLIDAGARLAEPGEFTRRAFTAGRMDLAEAEAVADLIAASSASAHRIALNQMRGVFSERLSELRQKLLQLGALLELELDFSEEDVEFADRTQLHSLATEIHSEISRLTASFAAGAAIKDGIPVAIVGATNAGKSTLLNALLGEDRAIVSDIRGTTRDTIEDTLNISGTLFRLIDTAGLRDTDDPIESLGISRSSDSLRRARIIVWVVDPADTESIADTAQRIASERNPDSALIVVLNKSDITPVSIENLSSSWNNSATSPIQDLQPSKTLNISAKTGTGLDTLRNTLLNHSGAQTIDETTVLITNARHYQALTLAHQSIQRVLHGLTQNLSGDFIAQDLRETAHHLSSITGLITTPDILSHIFSHFCIGK